MADTGMQSLIGFQHGSSRTYAADYWVNGTIGSPGGAFSADRNTGVRRISSDYMALVVGGKDAIRMTGLTADTPFGPRIGIGNLDEPGATDRPENLFHVHWSGTTANDGVVGITSQITNNAISSRTNPGVGTPDMSGVSSIIYQTTNTAIGAGRAFEGHAIRSNALAGVGPNDTYMGMELGIHTAAGGNGSFGPNSTAFPKTMGIWIGSYSTDKVSVDAYTAVAADVGLYLCGDLASDGTGGYRYPIFYHNSARTVCWYYDVSGNTYVGGGGNNAAFPALMVADENTGLFGGSNVLGFSTDGVERGRFTTTAFQIAANLLFDGNSRRIVGDFSNATLSNRTLFQDATTNNPTVVGILPNGTSTTSGFHAFNNSAPTNSAQITFSVSNTEAKVASTISGSGSALPLRLETNATQRLSVETNGDIVPGTAALATNATAGFPHMLTTAGTPSGAPTAYTGRVPFIYDSSTNKIWVRSGGTWRATAALT